MKKASIKEKTATKAVVISTEDSTRKYVPGKAGAFMMMDAGETSAEEKGFTSIRHTNIEKKPAVPKVPKMKKA